MKFESCNSVEALTAITSDNCGFRLAQAGKLGFADLPYSGTLGTAVTLKLAATMTALMAASDGTKVVVPKNKLYDPQFGGSEAVTYGSNDNTTPQGKTIMMGQTVPRFSANYVDLQPGQYEGYEDLFKRGNKSVDIDTLGVVFFLGDDQLLVRKPKGTTDVYVPFPMHSVFIGDPTSAGLHNLTMFAFSFELAKGWFREAAIIQLSYNFNTI